ncbi:hypothetical protein GGI12_006061, partial [Dipsacomyces acuminosporus]
VRRAVFYEPSDMVGHSALEFVEDTRDTDEIKEHHGSVTDDNVIMTHMILKSKRNTPVYIRTIAFSCGNVNFHMVNAYPQLTITNNRQSLERTLGIQGFKCLLSEEENSEGERQLVGRNMDATYSMRTSYQACFVLGDVNPEDPDSDAGPKIVFATESISRILDVESYDLQDVPFLSLVTMSDSEKAYQFLGKAMRSSELVLQRLHLLACPLEDSHLINPRSVCVEFMAMGSDDG